MRQRAFTLLEVLLVLAILVVVLAAAMPSLHGVMRDAALKSAADTVRVHWTKAHVKAMKTGRIQVFRFEQGGTRFTVQPWAAADDAIEAAPSVQGFGAAEEETASPRLDESSAVSLPEGTKFVAGAAALEGRSQSIEQDIKDANKFEADWSQPVLFYPDGSTSDAWVIVANERDVAIRVELRGMTGTTTIGEITEVEELKDQAERDTE
ncbi:MAG: prepilin-type N-terminal cleavage/methylation domain-containing protein [Planctomycetaceae bacterium]|nr:prepilin-type N-terminal cleavage/methylation domain-containing protein [Planctomycetaceae bacterium]